jgi:signal transduction histidine kinase
VATAAEFLARILDDAPQPVWVVDEEGLTSSPTRPRSRRSATTIPVISRCCARQLLDDAVEHAHAAIDELRELAAGLHRPVLAHRGLVVAVEELAARAVLPVDVTGSLPHRLPEAVEINAYFFVSEALTNTVKHANAARAAGSGLAGLADRVHALGGRMDVTSPPGRGTTVRAEIPVTPE